MTAKPKSPSISARPSRPERRAPKPVVFPRYVLQAVVRAEREDADRRDLAFLEVPTRIAGLECLPLTPRHLLCLYLAQSPFVCGGRVDPWHVAQFLWIVSPEFVLGDRKAARVFTAAIAEKVPFERSVKKIDAYFADAFADRLPTGKASNGPSIASFVASLVHELGRAYGWTRREVMDCPVAVLHQQLRYIAREDNAKLPLWGGRAERIKGHYMRRRKAAQQRRVERQATMKGVS